MAYRKKSCCLCLSDKNLPLTDLFSKDEQNSIYFHKISIYFLELATVINDLNCDCFICQKCIETVEMFDNFNQICLENIKKYAARRHRKKSKKHPKEVAKVKPTMEIPTDLMEICHVQIKMEPEQSEILQENPEDQTMQNEKILTVDFHEVNESLKYDFVMAEDGKKRYLCPICKKPFRQTHDLKRHEMIHTGIRPYMCEICGRAFNRKKHLNDHMLTHTGEKNYSCDVCFKKFRHKAARERHKQIHFGAKPFTCDICEKQFTQSNSLVLHKRTHSGEKPYECLLCGKSFTQKVALIGHKTVHTKEKPYSCDLCHKRFTLKSTIQKHKRKIHKIFGPQL